MLTASRDGTAAIWTMRAGSGSIFGANLRGTAISKNGQRIVALDKDERLILWDAQTKRPLPADGEERRFSYASISDDGRVVITVRGEITNQVAEVWNASSQSPPTQIGSRFPIEFADRATLSANGEKAASFGLGTNVYVWDVTQSTNRRTLAHPNTATCAVFSPDARYLFTACDDHTNRVWDSESGQSVSQMILPSETANAAFSPNGRYLAIAVKNGVVSLWDWKARRIERELIGHRSVVNSVAFSPSGRFIVTASGDNTARVWTAETGFCFAVLRGHTDLVTAAAFASTDTNIITLSDVGMARFYSCEECCEKEELLTLATRRTTRELTRPERQTYLHEPAAK